jgi:hypothetical protein
MYGESFVPTVTENLLISQTSMLNLLQNFDAELERERERESNVGMLCCYLPLELAVGGGFVEELDDVDPVDGVEGLEREDGDVGAVGPGRARLQQHVVQDAAHEVGPVPAPPAAVEGGRELAQELVHGGVRAVEHQHGVVEPRPLPRRRAALRAHGVAQPRERAQHHHVRVQVHAAVPVQRREPHQVRQILHQVDAPRVAAPVAQPPQPPRRGLAPEQPPCTQQQTTLTPARASGGRA